MESAAFRRLRNEEAGATLEALVRFSRQHFVGATRLWHKPSSVRASFASGIAVVKQYSGWQHEIMPFSIKRNPRGDCQLSAHSG